jgi:hypothetical protein
MTSIPWGVVLPKARREPVVQIALLAEDAALKLQWQCMVW